MHAAIPAEIGTTLIQKMICLRREEWRPEGAKSTLLSKYEPLRRSAFKNLAKFRQTFSQNVVFCLQLCISPILMSFRTLRNLYGKDQHPFDHQISWDFAMNILQIISENDFGKM